MIRRDESFSILKVNQDWNRHLDGHFQTHLDSLHLSRLCCQPALKFRHLGSTVEVFAARNRLGQLGHNGRSLTDSPLCDASSRKSHTGKIFTVAASLLLNKSCLSVCSCWISADCDWTWLLRASSSCIRSKRRLRKAGNVKSKEKK